QGFLLLRQWIPTDFVAGVRKSADTAMDLAIKNAAAGKSNTDICVSFKNNEPFISAVIHPHRYMYPMSLALLGSPWVLGIAESLCGAGSMTTYKSLVVKNRGSGEDFTWHQDMVHDRTSRIINISVFLSEASSTDDGLQVVPQTHFERQDMPRAKIDAEERSICLGAVPGDVTVHDVMTVHGSRALTQRERRMVFTAEFRGLDHLKANEKISRDWIKARKALQTLERHLYEQVSTDPGAGSDGVPENDLNLIENFCRQRCAIEPGNYDSGIAGEFQVPAPAYAG
ncbi:MAG TPA: hypothetical protein DHV36_06555, partial [Desulfobacteraceae bacterium]|nr:hypothetical protein [Desulfobacteraceae bacterium]